MWYLVILAILSFGTAYAQTEIPITNSTPCFLNETAQYHIIENCNANNDYLDFITLGWEWITGGTFSMILVSVLIVSTWIKTKEVIYPIFIGIVYLPISYFVFPTQFLSWAIVMAFVGVGILIWFTVVRQTER